MTRIAIPRPDAAEYAPYFARYVARVPDGDILETLERRPGALATILQDVADRDGGYRYGPDKWTIRQVVGHVADTERVMTYRALAFARGERAMLPGFDEDAYVSAARFDARTLGSLLEELHTVRSATVAFFSALDADELRREGSANHRPYTVRSLAWIIAGHELHHGAILRERYLPGLRAA